MKRIIAAALLLTLAFALLGCNVAPNVPGISPYINNGANGRTVNNGNDNMTRNGGMAGGRYAVADDHGRTVISTPYVSTG